jgi:hypothetical protein
MKLVTGHPDDQNAENAALAALHAGTPAYTDEWPIETAHRFLHAMTSGEAAAKTAGAPTEKDLATFVRTYAPSREQTAARVGQAIRIYEVVHGSDRVASEIVAHLERRADALWPVEDESDHLFTMLHGLAEVRDRMTHSDRSRLDARIRVLLAFHTKGTKVAEQLEAILKRPESIAPPPPEAPISADAPSTTPATVPEKRTSKKPAPAKKKAAKKKSK